ncbi:MAG: LUD domain-containing protein [Pirellulales bacterium]
MSSKSEILAKIRRQSLPESPLPSLDGDWIAFADKASQFAEVVRSVGGQVVTLADGQSVVDVVRGLPCWNPDRPIVSNVAAAPLANLDLASVADPHDLVDVELAILQGEFGVAENGAVWVTDRDVRHRAIYFITQHLVLVLPRTQLVDQMQQAYQRLEFTGAGYGLFISGPSKTADIEQSLVIGAHGPRSLTVILT